MSTDKVCMVLSEWKQKNQHFYTETERDRGREDRRLNG